MLAKLLDHNYVVAVPFGSQRYDFIVDDGKNLQKIQAKTGRIVRGAVKFNTCSTNGSSQKAKSYHGEIDAFVVYVPETEDFYWVPIAELPNKSQAMLRVAQAKNGQSSGVRFAEKYKF